MSTLSFRKVNKIYPNHVQAVYDFNLEIKDREFIVFVGPSGCGKTTTLRMVAGLEEISSGELYIDNVLVNLVPPKDRNIAMVFQNYALYPHMSVYENMAYGLRLQKREMPLYEPNPEVDAILEENKALWKEIKAINRKYKKKQDDLKLLPIRAELYQKLYAQYDRIAALQKPLYGRDERKIKKLKAQKTDLEKDIAVYQKLIAKRYANDEEKKEILTNGIIQRQTQCEHIQTELDHLENHDVPLTVYRRLTWQERDIEINKTADAIDLTPYLYRKPTALSGGQRQRVALGRAIVRKPKVFLMDEPLSNLDAKLRAQTRNEISKIHKRVGATTIYVTHDQTEAMTMADRIVIMKNGRVQQIGAPEEVYDDPVNAFVASFIGSPSMNFLEATVQGDQLLPTVKEIEKTGSLLDSDVKNNDNIVLPIPPSMVEALRPYQGKKVKVGIRPEHIAIDGQQMDGELSDAMELPLDFYELLGNELVLYTYLNGQKLVVKTPSRSVRKNDTSLSVRFRLDKMYFFDPETDERIRSK